MATEKQRRALDNLVENGGNVSKAMRDAGYTKETAKTPQKLTESVGFRELAEELGLTESFLTKALVDDIKTKKGNRKAELELGFKVLGIGNEKSGNTFNTQLNVSTDPATGQEMVENFARFMMEQTKEQG